MQDDERKPDIDADDSAVEARVKRLMEGDPSAEKPKPVAKKKSKTTEADEPAEVTTAPEIAGFPAPKEPLKIKVLKDDDDTEPIDPPEEKPEPPEPESPTTDLPEPEDDKTAKAVDDIVAHESDELLKAEDEKLAQAFRPEQKQTFGQKLKHFFRAWWQNPKARWATIIILVLAVAAVATIPKSRYLVLNTAGVRGSLSVQVLDESTLQPLKNVEISAQDVRAVTNTEGQARLEKVKLGSSELVIEKRAFAPIRKKITIGWGSNPQGETKLTPVGAQYSFLVTDFLSGKGIEKIEAISGEASALSDEHGKIRLTLEEPPDEIEVTIKGSDFREETFKINASTKDERAVQLVPARKQVFVSKRSGKYDVFKIDIDGKNEERILAGTGNERPEMVLIPHPKDEVVALVSTREGKRNSDGFLMSTLTIIDLSDNSTKSVVTSERVQLVDWIGDRLIYVQIAAGTSGANPTRHRLMSYNHEEGTNKELAASNTFNDVMVAAGKLYYAPSSAYQNAAANLYRLDADGTGRTSILGKEAWNLFRTAYDHIAVSATNEWYDYRLGDSKPAKLNGEPANLTSRVYVDGPDGKKSLWVDSRDGKGVLLAYDIEGKTDKDLRTQSGLKNPIRWLTPSTVVFRINTEQETADYALSLDGGDPRKIRDVTNTTGPDQWYYH